MVRSRPFRGLVALPLAASSAAILQTSSADFDPPPSSCQLAICEFSGQPCDHGSVTGGGDWCLPDCFVPIGEFEAAFAARNCIDTSLPDGYACLLENYPEWCELVKQARQDWLTSSECCASQGHLKKSDFDTSGSAGDVLDPASNEPVTICEPDLPPDLGDLCAAMLEWVRRMACLNGHCPELPCENAGAPPDPPAEGEPPAEFKDDPELIKELIRHYLEKVKGNIGAGEGQYDADDLKDWAEEYLKDCLAQFFGCCDEGGCSGCSEFFGGVIGIVDPGYGQPVPAPNPPPDQPPGDDGKPPCPPGCPCDGSGPETPNPVNLATGAKIESKVECVCICVDPPSSWISVANGAIRLGTPPTGWKKPARGGSTLGATNLRRTYSSRPVASGSDARLMGARQSSDLFSYIAPLEDTETVESVLLVGPDSARRFARTLGSGDVMRSPGPDAGSGPSQDLLELTARQHNGVQVAVYRQVAPDGSEAWYHRAWAGGTIHGDYVPATPENLVGLKLVETDIAGNCTHYSYSPAGPTAELRLDHMVVNHSLSDSAGIHTKVEYAWEAEDAATAGSLKSVTVWKNMNGGGVKLAARTRYRYQRVAGTDDQVADAVGTPGDLAMAVSEEWEDDGQVRKQVTLYRYHDGTNEVLEPDPDGDTDNDAVNDAYQIAHGLRQDIDGDGIPDNAEDLDGDGFVERGGEHQLKMVFEPEAVEWFAQHSYLGFTDPEAAGNWLLLHGDGDTLPLDDSPKLAWLASKVVAQYEDGGAARVAIQYVQQGCGCSGGGGDGFRIRYAYFSYGDGGGDDELSPVETVRMTYDVTGTLPFDTLKKVVYTDLARPDGGDGQALLVNEAIYDGDPATTTPWVIGREYLPVSHLVKRIYSAECCAAYAPVDGTTGPSADFSGPGLVQAFRYSDLKQRTHSYVSHGLPTDPDDWDQWILVERLAYYEGTDDDQAVQETRQKLPVLIERFPVAKPVAEHEPTEDETETTAIEYGFWPGTSKVAYQLRSAEAETVGENGPGGLVDTYTAIDIFDEAGRIEYRRQPEGLVTKYEYAATSGNLTKQTLNPSTVNFSGHPYSPGGLSWGGMAGGSLVTQYTYASDGRLRSVTRPDGTCTFFARRVEKVHPGEPVEYLTETALPTIVGSGSGAHTLEPARKTWMDAEGNPLRTSEFAVESPNYSLGGPTVPQFALAEELARTEWTRDVGGRAQAETVWLDFAATPTQAATALTYDNEGRLKWRDLPDGSYSEFAYDALDRLVSESRGVVSGSTRGPAKLVAKRYYDAIEDSGAPDGLEQTKGSGHLTHVRAFVGPTDGDYRETISHFDYRGRLVATENPVAPHALLVYDNLDRITRAASFGTLPSTLDEAGATTATSRISYGETFYSQRGLPYRIRQKLEPGAPDSGSGADAAYVESHTWYDGDGRVIESMQPDAPARKIAYDTFGRVSAEFLTDRAHDALPDGGTTGTYADAESVSDDHVLSESVFHYNSGGQLDLTTVLQRAHWAVPEGGSGPQYEGDLDNTSLDWVIRTFAAVWYDGAGRATRTVDFGTNRSDGKFKSGGTAPAWPPSSEPEWDDSAYANALVSAVEYDARGLPEVSVGPDGKRTRSIRDAAGRVMATVENDDASSPVELAWSSSASGGRWSVTAGLSASAPDVNRVTSYARDAAGRIVRQVAHSPGATAGTETVQVTAYDFGVTTSAGSYIDSNALVHKVRHPDPATGEASTAATSTVTYAYDRLGEAIATTDQNGTVHEFTLDAGGRLTKDQVTTFGTPSGSGIALDTTVTAIETSYDTLGRREYVRSKSGSATRDEVQWTYSGRNHVHEVKQNHDGTVGGSGGATRTATYAYRHAGYSAGNSDRPTTLTYPDGTQTSISYGATSSIDDAIGRATKIAVDGQSATIEFEGQFLGASRPVTVTYSEPYVRLDRAMARDGTDDVSRYEALDRFGRVAEHRWVDGEFGADTSNAGYSRTPPIVDTTYGYDKASNVTSKRDDRVGAARGDRHEEYSHDGLHRLAEAKRGVRNGSTFTYAATSQKWSLDTLGNWVELDSNANSSGTYASSETRVHDEANGLTSLDPDGSLSASPFSLAYDDAGNLASRETSHVGGGTTVTFVHDGWNRLVEVKSNGTTRVKFQYNGVGWQTVKIADTHNGSNLAVPDGTLDQERVMAYAADWRMLEERVYDGYAPSGGKGNETRRVRTYYGLRGAIDPVMCQTLELSSSGATTADHRHYLLKDLLGSVVAVLDAAGKLVEADRYDAYGQARHRWGEDVDGDGDVDSTDRSIVSSLRGKHIYQAGYNVDADLNRDGAIDNADLGLVGTASYKSALRSGTVSAPWLSTLSVKVDNCLGYAGYSYNPEVSLYSVRFRHFDPGLGRWVERDPAGFVDGQNLYQYVQGRPCHSFDPFGLEDIAWYEGLGSMWGVAAGEVADYFSSYTLVNRSTLTEGWGAMTDALGDKLYRGAANMNGDIPSAGQLVQHAAGEMLGVNTFAEGWTNYDMTNNVMYDRSGLEQAGQISLGLGMMGSWAFPAVNSLAPGFDITLYEGTSLASMSAALADELAEMGLPPDLIAQMLGHLDDGEGLGGLLADSPCPAEVLDQGATDLAAAGSDPAQSVASSAADAARLRSQLTAEEIAGGHAFDKHIIQRGEFPEITTRQQFSDHIESIINNPSAVRSLSNGRVAYWDDASGTVVIRNPIGIDGGTAFKPTQGKTYFDNLQ